MKLRANRNGKGYITSYTISIGCKEARDTGMTDKNGEPVELIKTVDVEAKRITIEAAKPDKGE